MSTSERIDEQVKARTQGRIRLIMVAGDYIFGKTDDKLIKLQAEKLGVTVEDIVRWFYED